MAKKPDGRVNDLGAFITQNLSGKGWKSGDFKPDSFGDSPFDTAATRANPPNTEFNSPEDKALIASVLKNPREAAAAEGPTYAAGNKYTPADIAKGLNQRGSLGMTPSSQAATAEGEKEIGSFLGRIFDYTDEADNPGEYVFDRMIQGLTWSMDKMAQGGVMYAKAAPFSGITETNETVTPGQAGVTATAQASNTIAGFLGGGSDLSNVIAPIYSAIFNPLGLLSDPQAQYGQEDFDINDPEQQKEAFVDNLGGKLRTGTTDAAFTLVADPTLYAAKGLSLARLRYLDDTFSGANGVARLRTQMVESLAKPENEKAGIARFAYLTTVVDPTTGKKVMPAGAIATRLRGATQGETMAAALHANKDEETAQLIIRYMFGDVDAGKSLIEKQPSIFLPIARKQREEIMDAINRSPAKRAKLEKNATDAEEKLTVAMAAETPGSAKYTLLERKRDLARDTYNAITNGKLADLEDMSNPIMQGLLSKEFKQAITDDAIIANALTDAQMEVKFGPSAFSGARRGFARDNVVGRAVEKSRLRRSNAAYEAAAARGEMRGTGKMIDLGDGKFVEEMQKTSVRAWTLREFNTDSIKRTINLWRWAGEQNPSGWVFTKGAAAAGSWKEVQAVVNDIDIYSGAPRRVVWTESVKDAKTGKTKQVEKSALVGGRQRKDTLIAAYMNAMKSTSAGADATQIALEKIEREIIKDIGQWHGMTADAVKDLAREMNKGRTEVISSIATTKGTGTPAFWVENGQTNHSPWLETHIQNGTYMLNYRALNKQLDQMANDGGLQKLNNAYQVASNGAKATYDAFNAVWRPSVLLRLGYTQRNVMEGLFRASAFTFSLDPVRQAAATGGYSMGNTYRSMGFRKAADSAEAAMRLRAAGDPTAMLPRHYSKWLEREIDAREEQIIKIEQFIEQPGRIIADVNKQTQQFMLTYYKNQEIRYADRLAKAKAAGAGSDEIQQIEDLIKNVQLKSDEVKAIKTFLLKDYDAEIAKINRKRSWTLAKKREEIAKIDDANSEVLALANRVLDDVESSVMLLDDSLRRRTLLDNDITSVADYLRSGGAKLRVHNGVIDNLDVKIINAAFNNNSSYAAIALKNLSADATTRAVMRSASNTMTNALKIQRLVNYTNVSPGDATYMDGVATALRQIKASTIGEMVIQGKSVKEIADYLYTNPQGRGILEFIVSGENGQVAKKANRLSSSYAAVDPETATIVAQNLTDRYNAIAPSVELREYMKGVVADDSFDGKVVDLFLGKKDAAGKYELNLQPVIGNMVEAYGTNKLTNVFGAATTFGMKWLGTIPEDAFVRAPFYGQRYEDNVREMIATLQGQLGKDGMISWKQYENIMRESHVRALKDTKEWMFTIERRTNLGTYGEVAVPFISAMQNSVTTVGRLLWNDPAIAVLMTRMWQAPSEMGIIDDNGTIRLPIPHRFLPDNFEELLGIEDMGEIKFNLSQFNLVAPQLEQGILFQFGPVAAIPLGFIMQNNMFGVGPDTPGILAAIPGGDAAWGTLKSVAFGKDGIPPSDLFESLSDLLPPWSKRFVAAFSQEGNADWDKIYVANLLTETLKKRGGLRDNYPTKEELINMTKNHLIFKGLSNLTVAFPPGYESILQPIVDDYTYMRENPITAGDADMRFSQKYGNDFLIAKDFGMTEGPVNPVKGMVDIARKHEGLISTATDELEDAGDLSVLSMMFVTGSEGVFDGTIYSWQMGNEIPGLSRKWRERQTPNEALVNDQKNAGWNKWNKALASFDARLAALGVPSYEYAPGLKLEKDTFLLNMAQDPLYSPWFRDYKEFGSSRTSSTITFMKTALADPGWMEEKKDSPIWQAAKQYLDGREEVLKRLSESGSGIDTLKNRDIKEWWDTYRSNLKMMDGWDAVANRFLDGDDDPQNPGVLSLIASSGGY